MCEGEDNRCLQETEAMHLGFVRLVVNITCAILLCAVSLSLIQQVLVPYDPKEKHLRVDKNVTLRVYLKDKAPGICTSAK